MSGKRQNYPPYQCRHCLCLLTNLNWPEAHRKIRRLLCRECTNRKQKATYRRVKLRDGTLKHRNKRKAIEYLGGVCCICGLKDACVDVYDFHHVVEKSFTVGNKLNGRWDRIQEELDKCVLMCANCHRRYHAKQENYDNLGDFDRIVWMLHREYEDQQACVSNDEVHKDK